MTQDSSKRPATDHDLAAHNWERRAAQLQALAANVGMISAAAASGLRKQADECLKMAQAQTPHTHRTVWRASKPL